MYFHLLLYKLKTDFHPCVSKECHGFIMLAIHIRFGSVLECNASFSQANRFPVDKHCQVDISSLKASIICLLGLIM